MSVINRNDNSFDDDEILRIARSVEAHDFDRIAPPPQVWNHLLAEVEVAMAAQEASARKRSRSWFSSPAILAAAAATVLLVGIAGYTLLSRDSASPPTELATAVMTDTGLPVATSEVANARVLCDSDDECFVEVELSGLPDAGDADLELWVINGDVTDMHSLGLLDASGRFPLPAGVTAKDFPIVDISVEPRDGVATHSGQSVLRGVLEEV
jgi:Anti-sigma-K factor rskA